MLSYCYCHQEHQICCGGGPVVVVLAEDCWQWLLGHLLVLSWGQEAPANNRVKCAYWNSLAFARIVIRRGNLLLNDYALKLTC